MAHFTVTHLEQGQVAEAWPIVRTAATGVSLPRWQAFAAGLVERGGGILAARAPAGAVHGVATYEKVDQLRAGDVLRVELLASFELSSRAPARRALCDALDVLASALGCDAIAVASPGRGFVGELSRKVGAWDELFGQGKPALARLAVVDTAPTPDA